MSKRQRSCDSEREERITMEIVVDAYGPAELAMGWYCYLAEHLSFPFRASCIVARPISPLRPDEHIEVLGMAEEEECEAEMFVAIRWNENDELAVPLAQLQPILGTDGETVQAVEDWHYWTAMGYQF